MNKTVTILTIVLLLVPVLAGGSIAEYKAYGSLYAPSFGGGVYHYTDGLVINGKIFDISGYSQKIPTQNLTVGIPSNITLKIFDNEGSYSIKTASLFLNIRGPSSSVSNSDAWIEYDLSGKTIVQEPHHFIGKVKGSVNYSGKVAYVSFVITPHSQMAISDLIVSSMDARLSAGYSFVVDAIAFNNKTTTNITVIDWLHHHCTTGHPCKFVCGDHICKPGEKLSSYIGTSGSPVDSAIDFNYDATYPVTQTDSSGNASLRDTTTGVSMNLSNSDRNVSFGFIDNKITSLTNGEKEPNLNNTRYYGIALLGISSGNARICIPDSSSGPNTAIQYWNANTWSTLSNISSDDSQVCGSVSVYPFIGDDFTYTFTDVAIGDPLQR